MDDFATFIANQRAELQKKRTAITDEIAKLNASLADIDREMVAIQAYEDAKTGKVKTVATSAAPRTRGRRGDVRTNVIEAIKDSNGLTRSELLIKLDAKGDKSAENSISNALSALKKAGTLAANDGVYTVVAG